MAKLWLILRWLATRPGRLSCIDPGSEVAEKAVADFLSRSLLLIPAFVTKTSCLPTPTTRLVTISKLDPM